MLDVIVPDLALVGTMPGFLGLDMPPPADQLGGAGPTLDSVLALAAKPSQPETPSLQQIFVLADPSMTANFNKLMVAIEPAPADDPLGWDDPQGNEGEEVFVDGKRISDKSTDLGGGGGSGSGTGGGGGGGGYGSGDGGGGATSSSPVATHTQDCTSEDGAADQVAEKLKGQLPPGVQGPPSPLSTPSGNTFASVEFGAIIVRNPDGSFGAFRDTIYSNDQPTWASLPVPQASNIQGIFHNHISSGNSYDDALGRYPSTADWSAAVSAAARPGSSSDPSLWIMGPDQVMREFKLSERAGIEEARRTQEGRDQLAAANLADKERDGGCGS